MKTRLAAAFLLMTFLGASGIARGEDWSREWAVGIPVQEATPIGDNVVNDLGGSNPGTGIMLRYGLDKWWALEGSYEYINVSRGGSYRSHLFAVSAQRSWLPQSHWRPFLEGGAGVAQTLSLRMASGVEYFWRSDFSARFQGTFYYLPDVGGTPFRQTAYVVAPGIMISYFFRPKWTAPPYRPPPPPPTPAIALTLTPSQVMLTASTTQQFEPTVTGADDKSVTWSLKPAVGSISNTGVYTAPPVIVQQQDVVVTATSHADPSLSASSVVTLMPAAPAAPAPVPAPAPKKVTIQLQVFFDTDKNDVKPQYHDEIKRVADFMTRYPNTKAFIEGHTDSRASIPHNMALSDRRAKAVRQYLIDQFHIDPQRLGAKGYGPTRPIATNSTPEGRAKNRRVIAVISAFDQGKGN